MADSTCNFFINSSFNANYDITWSFNYSLSGSLSSTGGFSTFLFNNPTLSGGGRYTALGYASAGSYSGVSGAKIGVLFDTSNTIKVLNGTNFSVITSFNLPSLLYPLVSSTSNFKRIRFNFTNVAQTLKISVENPKKTYELVASVPTGLSAKDTDFYKIGFGYSSPLSSGSDKLAFSIKDIQVQGNVSIPTTVYKPKPLVLPQIETYYILQSPLSGHINIGKPDPTSIGSLLHTK